MARTFRANRSKTRQFSAKQRMRYNLAWWAGFKAGFYDIADDGQLDGPKGQDAEHIAAYLNGDADPADETPMDDNMTNPRAFKTGYRRGREFLQIAQAGGFPDVESVIEGHGRAANLVEDLGDAVANGVNDPIGAILDAPLEAAALGADMVGAESFSDLLSGLVDGPIF